MNEDYLDRLYNSFDSIDPTFKNDISIEVFKQKMQDVNYARKIYDTLSSVDDTYSSDVPFDSFIEKIKITPKKKGESMVSDSEVSSSELPSGEQPKLEEIPFSLDYQKQQQQVPFQPSTPATQPEQKRDVSKLKEYDTTQQYDRYGVPVTQFPTAKREEYLAKPVQQIETKVKFEEKKEEFEKQVPGFLKPSVETIDKNFLSRKPSFIVDDLNRQYKDAGFEFTGSDFYENVKVTAPNGKTLSMSTNAYVNNVEDEAERLKFFIKENSPSIGAERVAKLQKEYEQGNQNFLTQKQIDDQSKAFNESAELLQKEIQSFLPETDAIKNLEKQLESYPEAQKNTPQYKSLVDNYNAKLGEYNIKAKDLETKIQDIQAKEDNLKKTTGEYTKYKAQQGSFTGFLWNQFTDAIGGIASQWTEFTSDRYWNNVSLPLVLGRESYNEIFNTQAKTMFGDKKFLTNEEIKTVDDKIRDDYKKLQKTGKIERLGLDLSKERITSNDIREFFTKNLGTLNTTKEYQEQIKKRDRHYPQENLTLRRRWEIRQSEVMSSGGYW
jgi:hypothetical protein